MFGSKSHFFYQSVEVLSSKRRQVVQLLKLKGYNDTEIAIYIKAYNYFCQNPAQFDGATIVKDLVDIPGLDLDAMLHDYHYIHRNVAANFVTKWKADLLFLKGNRKKGKGNLEWLKKHTGIDNISLRFIGLTVIGIGFVVYAFYKRGKIKEYQKNEFLKEYQILIK